MGFFKQLVWAISHLFKKKKEREETKNFIEPTGYFSIVHHSLNKKFSIISILIKYWFSQERNSSPENEVEISSLLMGFVKEERHMSGVFKFELLYLKNSISIEMY